MSKFTKISSSPNEQSLNFIIPIVVLLLIGMLYVMTQRADTHFANFVLIGAGAITAIYWISVIKKMTKEVVVQKFTAREAEAKNWVYDLIKGVDEIVFVAEKDSAAFLLLLKKTTTACRPRLAKRLACLRTSAIQARTIARTPVSSRRLVALSRKR